MEKSQLKSYKVVLFGAGKNGRNLLAQLADGGVLLAYFVDNNAAGGSVAHNETSPAVSVKPPEALLSEEKRNLKNIITPDAPLRFEIIRQR